MATVIEEFDSVRITNFGVKFKAEETSTLFGCVGQIKGETEIKTVVKNCEGIQVKQKSTPVKMTLTVNAHVKVAPLRKIFGLTSDGLKPGIYSYGRDSKAGEFCLTADVIDEFEDLTKLIAFPNCVSNNGLTLSIENGADEVAELEMEYTAMIDENNKCYYEAMIAELEDPSIADTWRTNFTPDLAKEVPTP